MTTLDDVDQLTTQRFRRMSPGNQQKPPPVDDSALPPGPRWPVLVQTAGLLRFRHRFHPYMRKKYGDIFTVRIAPGGRPLVFFTRPEHAKEIFAGDPEVFHAGKANGILGPIMGEHSLLLQDSSQHKRARKLLMPAFNGHALREYQALVTEVARAEVATWRDGEEFRSLDRMNRAHPRGDPARRLRRHRRGAARRSCGRASTPPSTSAPRSCSAGATPGCRSTARGSAPSTTSASSTC